MKQKHPLKKPGVLLLAIMLLVCSMIGTAFAEDTLPAMGNITINLTTELGTPKEGVTFRLYQVKSWKAATENWLPVPGQSDPIVLRAGMSGSDWANAARTLAQQPGLNATATGKTDSNGTLIFSNLPLGMYLVVQEGANNYGTIAPFLAALPYISTDGNYTYDYAPAYYPKAAAFSAPTPDTTPAPDSSGHDHVRRTPTTSAEAISPLPPVEEDPLPPADPATAPDNTPQQPTAPTTSEPLPADPQPTEPALPDEPSQPADGDTTPPDQQPQNGDDAPEAKNGWVLPTAAGVAAAAAAGGIVLFRKRSRKTQ